MSTQPQPRPVKVTKLPPQREATINIDPARSQYINDVLERIKARKQQQGKQ